MNTNIQLFKDAGYLANPTTASADQMRMRREDLGTVVKVCELVLRKVDLDIDSTNVISTLAIKATNLLNQSRGEI